MFSPRQEEQLALVKNTKERGLYYFQKALDGKSGPIVEIEGKEFKMMSSYDYLGLIGHKRIEEAAISAIKTYSTGSGGVRLLTGTNKLHVKLEENLADFLGTESAITYTSGYTANLAILSALLGSNDVVLVDNKIHQSTIDACKLAGVNFRRFEHNDMNSLEGLLELYYKKKRILVISEGVFSMDGDVCDLKGLVELKKKYGAYLMIDEAHSLGVIGEQGRGVASHCNVSPREIDIYTGSLSKAIPANGGFIASSLDLITILQHSSSPFVFSAAMGPASVAAVMESIAIMKSEPTKFDQLRENTKYFSTGLKNLGFDIGASTSPVIPVLLGDLDPTLKFAEELYKNNILITPVLFPAVAHGQGRLRICITAAQTIEYLDEVLEVFKKLA